MTDFEREIAKKKQEIKELEAMQKEFLANQIAEKQAELEEAMESVKNLEEELKNLCIKACISSSGAFGYGIKIIFSDLKKMGFFDL